MKILHMMLSSFYIDDYAYQENILPKLHLDDGHEVRIIASTETFLDNQGLGYTTPSSYFNSDGIPVLRVPYSKLLPHFLAKKVRSYPGIYEYMESFGPDVILFHGSAAWELLTVGRYKRNHPNTRLYVDTHSDYNNSGTTLFSRLLLHKIFYRFILQAVRFNVDKFLCVTTGAKNFLIESYGIPESSAEFYPLGGMILPEDERSLRRNTKRRELGLEVEHVLFVHSGKMDEKKRTEELIIAFSRIQTPKHRLVLLGSIPPEVRERIDSLIEADSRIEFHGWKNASELLDYLCACDMYVQPGGQSVTMQMAMCTFAPVMLFPHESHKPYMSGNGLFVKNIDEMSAGFSKIAKDSDILKLMRVNSARVATEILDYRKLAARIYR